MAAIIGSDINGYRQAIGCLFSICIRGHTFDHGFSSTRFDIQNVFIAHLLEKLEHTNIAVIGIGPW